LQSLTRDAKSLVDLPVPGHGTGVFIGTQGAACPCQIHLDPRVPVLSPKYSHEGRLQTVIMVNFITDTALITRVHAGPGQLYGPNCTWASLGGERVGGPVDFGGAFVLSRVSEGGRTGLHPVKALGLSCGVLWIWPSPAQGENEVGERRVACSPSPNICPPRDHFD
jgi:hypothetical protein